MFKQEYLDEMKKIQENILYFIENEEEDDGNFQNFIQIINDFKICDNQHKLKSVLYLITNISQNHHRGPNFSQKIKQILNFLKDKIKIFFSNWDIFNIFINDRMILLYLIEEQIIIIDEPIVIKYMNKFSYPPNYTTFFQPEFKPFLYKDYFHNYEIPENFSELRRIGENDSYICELIRNDSIVDFITYVHQKNIPLTSNIPDSIFETNSYLNEIKYNYGHMPTLIEYAAFFGSIQIFKYLFNNDAKFESTLWYFAIHSQNNELIGILEEEGVQLVDFNVRDRHDESLHGNDQYINMNHYLFYESIKCHHINIARYLMDKFQKDDDEDEKSKIFYKSLRYYNFAFIQEEFINKSCFQRLCSYDYYILVDILLKQGGIDLNEITILPNDFLIKFKSANHFNVIINENIFIGFT